MRYLTLSTHIGDFRLGLYLYGSLCVYLRKKGIGEGDSNLWNLKCKSLPVGVEAEQISIYKVGKSFNVFEGVGRILSPIWGKRSSES